MVKPLRLDVGPHQVFEVLAIVGDDSPPLGLGHSEDTRIIEAALFTIRGQRDHVVTKVSKSRGYLAAEVLVEEQSHARAACARRQADSASAAPSRLRAMRSSISVGKAS